MQAARSSDRPGSPSGNVAAASREAFARWVDEGPEGRTFGQVRLRSLQKGGYELRHVEDVDAENVVLIPVFIAEGWHTRETIPEDLGLTGEVTRRPDGKTVFYGAPVGTHPSMSDLIVARARETEEQLASGPL